MGLNNMELNLEMPFSLFPICVTRNFKEYVSFLDISARNFKNYQNFFVLLSTRIEYGQNSHEHLFLSVLKIFLSLF